jgi:mannan endo-1,4-beta-mannosidase
MKKIILIILTLMFWISNLWPQGFTISGTKLLDANGNNFIIRGISVPLVWFVSDVNNNIINIRNNTNANCLRIVLNTLVNDNDWHTCVEKCIENKMIPMLELHDATCGKISNSLQNMANWWVSKASYLKDTNISKFILINIANEWGDWWMADSSPTAWRDAYKDAIATIRDAGINTTLVIDAPNCGQDIKTRSITNYSSELQNHDPQHNLLFSVHTYCEWKISGSSNISTDLPAIKNAGIPVIVGEFGFKHSENEGTCDIDASLLLSTCRSDSIGWIAWSWKGNNSPVQYLDLSTDWTGNNLSSWGDSVINSPNGLKNTAQVASVFIEDTVAYPQR